MRHRFAGITLSFEKQSSKNRRKLWRSGRTFWGEFCNATAHIAMPINSRK